MSSASTGMFTDCGVPIMQISDTYRMYGLINVALLDYIIRWLGAYGHVRPKRTLLFGSLCLALTS